ncbi:ATP-binding cassette sub-family G member 4-like [Epargyreus clarus]|uniref:ATP-binding cassette sub-family G member 4-like n=1 Tax=Epargyreus clarus TaxID=520877 RepID=UPI003C2ADFFC
MANALAILQGLGQKVKRREHNECRTLQINMPQPKSVDIEFKDINLTITEGITKRKSKTILKGVSGVFKSGELTAIMGPSGAGKSSLLNTLTGFSTYGVTGTIRAGDTVCKFGKEGTSRSLQNYRKKSCYIMQDDKLNPLFTVSELMTFAADMKLGNTLTKKLKDTVISEVLDTLGLAGTENTRCCNLSGGQRKRLSIALELIDNPPVLYLDEPTTGLDSLTSTQCVGMLKELARNGRTIVCTIHQPPASLFKIFDQVYVLAEGMCIYSGTSENTVPYFASVGLQCPMYHNPADYMLEVANGEYGKFNEILAKKCMVQEISSPTPPSSPDAPEAPQFSCGKMSIVINKPHELYKFGILFKRCLVQQYRDWTTTHLKVVLHVMTGVLLGILYGNAGNDASKTFSNLSYFIVSAVYLCYTSLMPAVLKFPAELGILKKENFNSWYNLKTYYAAVLLTSMPLQIMYSVVYSAPSYFLSGQPPELARYGMFVLTLANITLLADAIGNVIGTCVNPVNGTFLGAITTCAMIVYAGYLVLYDHMHPVMRVVSYSSFLRYGFEGMVLSVYSYGREPLICPSEQLYCHMRYPSEIIKQLRLTPDNYWFDIAILAAEVIVVRIIAYLTLKRFVRRSR